MGGGRQGAPIVLDSGNWACRGMCRAAIVAAPHAASAGGDA